jgi:hypothetical protein
MMTKIIAAGAGMAALAAAAPAASQYYGSQYGSSRPYAYGSQYGYTSPYAYGSQYGVNSGAATQQCTAAVQNRLYNRTSLGGILGSLVGIPAQSYGRVLSITSMTPTRNGMRIRGLATSGRTAYNSYGPYGVGAYGALGYGAASADLSFKCDVDYRGYVRDVDVNRRF